MYARCVICCAICDSDAISAHFERCFDEHLPIDQPQLNRQQGLINRPLLPLFGDTLPYVDEHEGIADTILAQLGPIAYGRLSQTSVEWRRSTQSVRPLRLWFNQQIAALRGTMTMPDCSCGPSFLRALPDDASRSECGLAGARLERGMSLEKVFHQHLLANTKASASFGTAVQPGYRSRPPAVGSPVHCTDGRVL